MTANKRLYKPQRFILESGTYPFSVICFVNQTNDQVEKFLLKFFSKDVIDKTSILNTNLAKAVYLPKEYGVRLMMRFVGLHKDCNKCLPVIAHECFHCAENLFLCIGLEYNFGSSEAFAYQIQYYCGEFLAKLK